MVEGGEVVEEFDSSSISNLSPRPDGRMIAAHEEEEPMMAERAPIVRN